MKPIIGITTHLSDDERTMQLNRTYSNALIKAGALPVLLPATTDPSIIDKYSSMVDGLLLSGGGDVDPQLFGETTEWACGTISPLRDVFELALCKALLNGHIKKPIFGICRGFQVLNIALGGTIYQDIQTGVSSKTLSHRQKQRAVYPSHSVAVTPGSMLHRIVNCDALMVNSLHHQALKDLPDGFVPTAVAPDGIVEAAELSGHPSCFGVQWHPEQLIDQPGCDAHWHLFLAFVANCKAIRDINPSHCNIG